MSRIVRLNDLPSRYFKRAMPYLPEDVSMAEELNRAFLWVNSIEGELFWYTCEDACIENEHHRFPNIPPISIDDFNITYIADAKLKERTMSESCIWDGLVNVWTPDPDICSPQQYFRYFVTPALGEFKLPPGRYFQEHIEWMNIIKKV